MAACKDCKCFFALEENPERGDCVQRVVDPLQQMRGKIEELRSVSGAWAEEGASHRVTEILEYISRRIPPDMDVELLQLVIGAGEMTLGGNTDSYNTVNEMKNALSREDFFSGVEISTATVNARTGKIQFTLRVDL